MLSLLSRAAQAHASCRCRLCLRSANTIARRSTTAASRAKVSVADIFTACYTTILGTATVIDSHRKKARRKNLDEQLEKTKASLHGSSVQDPSTRQSPGEDVADTGVSVTSKGRFAIDHRRRSERIQLLRELSHLCGVPYRPPPRSLWIEDQINWARIEADVAVEASDPDYTLREPKNDHQLQRTTATIIQLVDRLLSRVQVNQSVRVQDDFESNSPSLERAEATIAEFENLRWSQHWPSYEMPSAHPENAATIRSLLAESVRRIFNQAASTKEIVGKICFNLLASSVPPSIHTYNALIAGFNRIQRPDLAQIVIDSYVHDTSWPATQQTIMCLLSHYRVTDEINGLRDTVKRMRGVKDTGLHFRILPRTNWLNWATENYAGRKNAFVLRAYRGNPIFDSIIAGWLHYGEVGNATMVFVACLRNGGSVPPRTLQTLLRACVNTVDLTAARKLVMGIAKHFGKFAATIHYVVRNSSTATSRVILNSLSHLLDICWLPYDFICSPFTKLFDQATKQLKVLVFITQAQLEVLETAELCISTLKSLNTDGPLDSGIDRAIHVFDTAQTPRKRFLHTMDGCYRRAGLLAVSMRYRDLQARIKPIAIQAKAAILKEKTGYDFDPSGLLESEFPESRVQQLRYRSICNALEHIEIRSGPMTQEDVRSQLFERLPSTVVSRRLENSGNSGKLAIRILITFYRPHYLVRPSHNNPGYSKSIWGLERDIINIEDDIRAILFAHVQYEKQKLLMFRYPRWHNIPLGEIVKYHLRVRPEWAGPPKCAQAGDPSLGTGTSTGLTEEPSPDLEGPLWGIQRLMEDW
ncbi:hypothetical protein F5X99DRAFT_411911 [Biscogniauxia marginata]|nr:hypothetical protein F5X99DRAFT_411911 [Biscogniauxia marginata]